MNKIKAAVVAVAAVAGLAVAVPPVAQAANGCKTGGHAYMCEFGITTKKLPDGTKQVFVVGTERAVWTRWTDSDGDWSEWESMGGRAVSTVVITDEGQPWQFAIHTIMPDGYGWYRLRNVNGYWTDWARNPDPK
jgi:hypothetical protein